MSKLDSKKLHFLEYLLIIATLLVIGLVSYAVYQARSNEVLDLATQEEEVDAEATAIDSEIAADLPTPPQISNVDDLDKALQALQEVNLEEAHYDSELSDIERET
ncbi:MAG: hypothetical protein WD061_00935 [Candidatus Saccharimonadales bacterium]